jgi:hypothetical protein
MPKIWIVKPNLPEDWTFNGVEVSRGKRTLGGYVDEIVQKKFIQCINISDSDDGCEFLNELSKGLECADSSTHANTVQVYSHPHYNIECTYRSDLNFQNSQAFNYFGTVVNIESINMFGPAVFFKIANKKLINLELEELINQIVNFYYLETYKLSGGSFEKIGINNFEPEITRILNGYKVKKFGDWFVFSDDPKSNLNELKQSKNNINEFNNMIWLKVKTHIGDIHEALESTGYEKNKDGDLRGLYMDLDPEYIKAVFFS